MLGRSYRPIMVADFRGATVGRAPLPRSGLVQCRLCRWRHRRHSCVQRLLNAHFSLKHIGDYVGHRSASSTQIYGKIAIEQLREVALGDGEDVL